MTIAAAKSLVSVDIAKTHMKKKSIVAILGEQDSKLKDLIGGLCKNRYKCVSISKKVQEISKYITKMGSVADLETIRDRGYKVHKLYWINLLLSSLGDDVNVVVDDINEMDIVDGVMYVYYSSNEKFVQGCTNVYSWDEERVKKEISRLLKATTTQTTKPL